jgi:hypothetical protein
MSSISSRWSLTLSGRIEAVPQTTARTPAASAASAANDTFAIVTRPGTRLSPGVRELLTDLEVHMRAVADKLDRSR